MSTRPRLALAFTLALMLPAFAIAKDAKRPITAQDLWAVKRVGAPALSPDGRRAVVGVQEWSIDRNKPTTSLWLVEIASAKVRRLTFGDSNDGAAAWSYDGTRIAFVAKRNIDTAASLYVIGVDGGEAERVLDLPHGVVNPRWLPNDAAIVFGTRVDPALAGSLDATAIAAMRKQAKQRASSKMSAWTTEVAQYRWFDHNLTDGLASRLVRIDLASGKLTDLTPGFDRLFSAGGDVNFQVAPDGRQVALVVDNAPPPFVNAFNLDIVLVPTDGSGKLKNLTADNEQVDDAPRFTPDGRSILFMRQVLPLPPFAGELRRLWRHDLASGHNTPLAAGTDLGIDDVAFAADARTLWVVAEDHGQVPIFRLGADGSGFAPVFAEGSNTEIDSANGTLVFLHEDSSRAAELYTLADGKPRQLTHFNDALFAGLDLGKVESHTFTGAAGDTVQLWLTYPPGYDPNKKYPLVQVLHGGPQTMVRDAFGYRWNNHVFASPGYLVSQVNRHGSTGFGEAFARSMNGAWGDKPMEDILKANAWLFDKVPAIDRDRVAAAGASYGGYLATWMLGHTDAFKALVNHAGVGDLIGQYGSDVVSGLFSAEVMGGVPWDKPEAMQRNNPIAYAANFRTPMLITHGEKDYRVPYGLATALYGILQAKGVPSRLVVFPDENHWILSPQNSIYWNYEVQSWLARYIGGQPMAKPEFKAVE
ncbi:MAG: prolyl oligopeptidase family serine peptidase [Arenimonas sp.]